MIIDYVKKCLFHKSDTLEKNAPLFENIYLAFF